MAAIRRVGSIEKEHVIKPLAIGFFVLSTIGFSVALLAISEDFPHPDDALEFIIIAAATAFGFWTLGWMTCIFRRARSRLTFVAGAVSTIVGMLLWFASLGV